jgi:hypothetical protein
LIELLFLLLLLLRAALLHRRRLLHQRMSLLRRILLLWRSKIPFPSLRITIRHLAISILGPVLARAALLLVHARLRLRHLLYLAVAAGRSKRPEAALR